MTKTGLVDIVKEAVKKADYSGRQEAKRLVQKKINDQREAGISEEAIYARQPYISTEIFGYVKGFFKGGYDFFQDYNIKK